MHGNCGSKISRFSSLHKFIPLQNLVIDLACYNNLNYSAEICTNLSAHQAEQIEVQKLVATMTMYQSILSSIPGIIVCLFIGPWSDTNGRKPALLIPMVGLTLGFVVWICLARFRSTEQTFLFLG